VTVVLDEGDTRKQAQPSVMSAATGTVPIHVRWMGHSVQRSHNMWAAC